MCVCKEAECGGVNEGFDRGTAQSGKSSNEEVGLVAHAEAAATLIYAGFKLDVFRFFVNL